MSLELGFWEDDTEKSLDLPRVAGKSVFSTKASNDAADFFCQGRDNDNTYRPTVGYWSERADYVRTAVRKASELISHLETVYTELSARLQPPYLI